MSGNAQITAAANGIEVSTEGRGMSSVEWPGITAVKLFASVARGDQRPGLLCRRNATKIGLGKGFDAKVAAQSVS
jgi:hypothetical protein